MTPLAIDGDWFDRIFYQAPGVFSLASMESGSTDVVQIHSIIVQRPKRWSGASDADPRESHGKSRATNCDSQRHRSDNDWPGKAPPFCTATSRRHSCS